MHDHQDAGDLKTPCRCRYLSKRWSILLWLRIFFPSFKFWARIHVSSGIQVQTLWNLQRLKVELDNKVKKPLSKAPCICVYIQVKLRFSANYIIYRFNCLLRIICIYTHIYIVLNWPFTVFKVWSADGPVLAVSVAPWCSVQSKSSDWRFFHVHSPDSKVQLPSLAAQK